MGKKRPKHEEKPRKKHGKAMKTVETQECGEKASEYVDNLLTLHRLEEVLLRKLRQQL